MLEMPPLVIPPLLIPAHQALDMTDDNMSSKRTVDNRTN